MGCEEGHTQPFHQFHEFQGPMSSTYRSKTSPRNKERQGRNEPIHDCVRPSEGAVEEGTLEAQYGKEDDRKHDLALSGQLPILIVHRLEPKRRRIVVLESFPKLHETKGLQNKTKVVRLVRRQGIKIWAVNLHGTRPSRQRRLRRAKGKHWRKDC